MVLLLKLFFLPLLLPFVSTFQVIAPSQVTVGKTAEVQWIRHNGDPSSFSLLLRKDNQDRGGTLIQTIRSSDSQGTESFTATQETNYLIEVISDLHALQDDQQPENIFATTSKISAVQDSNLPQISTSASSTTSRTTQTTPTNTATDRGGNSDNNGGAGTTESTNSGGGGNTVETISSPVPASSASAGAFIGTQIQQTVGSNTETAGLTSLTSARITPTDSNTSSPAPTFSGGPSLSGASSSKANIGVIAGSAIGGLIFLFILSFFLFLYNRRKRRRQTLEYAFRRDLMVRHPDSENGSFQPVSPSQFNTTTTGPSTHVPKISEVSNGGFTTYQKYWESQGMPDGNKSQNENTNPLVHDPTPSTSTYASSSSLSVFYTAVPKSLQPPQPALAPGFTFPARPNSPTQTTISASTSTRTDRQIAIQNKMNHLRNRMIELQSKNARGSGFTEDSKSASEEGGSERGEIVAIREELERLGEIMNSGWAMRRTESGGDVPAGLKA